MKRKDIVIAALAVLMSGITLITAQSEYKRISDKLKESVNDNDLQTELQVYSQVCEFLCAKECAENDMKA